MDNTNTEKKIMERLASGERTHHKGFHHIVQLVGAERNDQNTGWELIKDDPILREREFARAPLTLTLSPATNTQTTMAILFGREPVSQPFVLTLSASGQSASVWADGVGNF